MSQAGANSGSGGGGGGNILTGSGTSTNGSTSNLVTFDLGNTGKVYRFYFMVAGRDVSNDDGIGYHILASAKTDGVTADTIATEFIDADEDASLMDAEIDFIVSGNNIIVQATGVAGKTINYMLTGSYISV